MLDGLVPPLVVCGVSLALTAGRRYRAASGPRGIQGDLAIVAAIVVVAMILELEMGRTPTYRNGPVRLWSGDISSDQNSQQIFDPYSFTHVIHGAAFYGLTRLLPGALTLGTLSLGTTAIIVVTVEAAWEVYENTDQVINRYRAATVSLGYYGDSLINSLFDILACLGGLLLAWRRPAWVTLGWVVAVEIVLAIAIRDNLTLNLIMLIHPVQAIRIWQLRA